MDTQNKRIVKNTIALFIRMCFIAILGLVSSRFMLQYLGEIDFGIYNVVGGVVNLMAFLNIVLASATNRFLTIELGKKEKGDIGKVFSTSLLIHAIIALIVIVIGETFGLYYVHNYLNVPIERLETTILIFHISLFACAICVLQVPFQGLLISHENFTRFSIVQVIMMIGILAASLAIGHVNGDRLIYFAIYMALAQLLGLLLYFCLSQKYVPCITWNFDGATGHHMINFSTWIALGAASAMGKNQGSNIVLNYFFGPVVNSAFSIGNQVNVQISRMSENVSKSFGPQIIKNYVAGEYEHMITLMAACSKYSFFLLYCIALPFFCNTDYILRLWLGTYPQYTITFCNIIMINILLSSLSQGFIPAIQATGKIKWFQIISSTMSLFTIPLACLFFWLGASPYLLSIAFVSTAIGNIFVDYYMMRRILNFPVRRLYSAIYFKVLPVIAITTPWIYIERKIFTDNTIELFISILLSLLLTVLSIYIGGTTSNERIAVKQIVKKYTK